MRKIKGNLLPIQENMLVALYTLTAIIYLRENYMPLIRGRGVADILGGAWSTYRHKTMLELAKNGWVEMRKERNKGTSQWYYGLTIAGYNTINDRVNSALKSHIKLTDELL